MHTLYTHQVFSTLVLFLLENGTKMLWSSLHDSMLCTSYVRESVIVKLLRNYMCMLYHQLHDGVQYIHISCPLFRYKCSEEIVTISAMLSVNNAVFYRPKVCYVYINITGFMYVHTADHEASFHGEFT